MKKFNNSPEMLIVAFGLIFVSIIMLATLFYTPPLATATVIYSKENNSNISESENTTALQGATVADTNSFSSKTVSSATAVVNINTATLEELSTLKDIGNTKAQKIIDYRNSKGNFVSTEEIMNVSGIGEKTYENIKNQICV